MENILGKWEYNTEYNCYCMYGLVYTKNPLAKKYQCLNIFVPKSYINEDGTINENATCGNYNCNTAPIIFENNSARFSNMEPEALGSDRNYAPLYLKKGMVFISCGVRGRETKTEDGKCIGKIPANLIDVKTAIRFIKHYKQYIPGNTEQIISCGFSAGGAMSSLTGVSTDNAVFDTYLEENGVYYSKDLFLSNLDLFLLPCDIFIKKFELLKQKQGDNFVDKLGEYSSLIELMYED